MRTLLLCLATTMLLPVTGTAQSGQSISILLTFGIGDTEGRDWSGEVALSDGRILAIRGHQFDDNDAILSTSAWKMNSLWETLWNNRTHGGMRASGMICDFQAPVVTMKVVGTDNIRWIDVIRDNEFVYQVTPDSPEAGFTFVDRNGSAGTHFYYVRVMQQDEAMAWASPVWIDYQP